MTMRTAIPSVVATGACLSFALLFSGCGSDDGAPPPEKETRAGVTVKRDTYGVPHVYADTVRNLFYGFGYSVAEDRLFQMEMARRAVLGTVSEVLGANYLALDRSSRASFDPVPIRAQLARLSQSDRDIFDGYAAGYNARVKEVLANRSTLMPRQFIDAGFEPQEWTGYDVAMIWVGTMANRYSNGNSEVANLQLLNQLIAAKGNTVGRQLFDQIRWLEDTKAPTTVPRTVTTVASKDTFAGSRFAEAVGARLRGIFRSTGSDTGDAQVRALTPVSPEVFIASDAVDAARRGIAMPDERPVASNLWIAGPSKTTDGSTVLVNGPQFGWVNPAYVYGIGLHGAGFDVTGNTPFAHPVVLFGTNGKISWGATAGPLDVNDTYQERLNPTNQYEYLYNGGYRPMTKTTEVIKVKGAADDNYDIYATVHGRVTSFDAPNNTAYSLKRSWDGYELESLLGWIHSMRAQSWDEWLAQASRVAITINWYYADSRGNIGYVSPGRLPARPASQDVRLPALGDGTMEWLGIRPFSDNPKVLNPSEGFVANWNNQSAPGVTSDGGNYGAVDRVNEIRVRLQAKAKFTPDEVWAINRETSYADVNARYFIPHIVEATANLPATDPVAQAAQTLKNWDLLNKSTGDTGYYDSPAVTIMRAWLPAMYARVLQDDLPAVVYARYTSAGYPGATTQGSTNVGAGSKLIYNALLGPGAGVPQTIDFFNGADRNAVIRAALGDALAQVTATYGADPSKWLTPATNHSFPPTNFIGAPQAGASETLVLPTFMNRGTENDRVIFGAGGSVSLCTVAPPGQSGFIDPQGAKSRHYSDQLALYHDFGCKPDWLTERELDSNLESTKVLAP